MENKPKEKKVLPTLRYFFPDAWRRSKAYFILSAVNVVIEAARPFVSIIILPLLLDALIAPVKDIPLICLYGALTVLLTIIFSLLNSTLTVHLEKYEDFFLNSSAKDLSRRCMEIDFALTEDKAALDQIHKAREGLGWSGGVHRIATSFFSAISNGLKIFGTIGVMAVSAPWLLVIVGVLVLASAVFNKKRNDVDVREFSRMSKIDRVFGYLCWDMEDFRCGKDIRLFGAQGMMLEKASKEIERLKDYWQSLYRMKLPFIILDIIVIALRDFGTYLYLGVLAITGRITIGVFSQLVSAAGTLANALQEVIKKCQEIVMQCGYAYEVVKFMEYPPYLEKGTKKIADLKGGHTIEFRNVGFSYPGSGVKVLQNVSLTLHSGEKISLVGLNGAGKTTFVKLLCRLYDPDEGEILLDGVNIREYDYEEYMELFSVVFQDFRLLSFSVNDNILLGGEDSGTVDVLLEKVGLKEKVDNLPQGRDTPMFRDFEKEGVELSGGEQQKLAIARALYKDASVVILDEPTAALDPVAEYEIYRQFNELVDGKTAVYISHRLSSCKFCDRIAVFEDGTVKESGTHDQLLRQEGLYSRMFTAQAQYYI